MTNPTPLAPTNPRPLIRQFLTTWLTSVEGQLPPAWPELSPADFAGLMGRLREPIQLLYNFVDQQKLSRNQKLSVRLFGESALALLRLDWQQPSVYHQASPNYCQKIQGRPAASMQFDQLYCTPDSAERRVHRFAEELPQEGTRVLFLGDDDLLSIAADLHTNAELHMLDLDDRLLSFVGERAPNVQLHKIDLEQGGIPDEMAGSFDAVFLDPPWDYMGCWFFLNKAIHCLKNDLNARIFLSFTPTYLEYKDRLMNHFWQRLGKLGLTVESMHPYFSLYDMAPEVAPGYRQHLDGYLPEIDSPLLEILKKAPYAFSHLYVLRRLPYHRQNSLAQWWFQLWNRGSEIST